MNRSILIIICDFLLISLLAFSAVDVDKPTAQVEASPGTNQLDAGKDLASVMKLALEEEKKGRDQLLGELQKSRASAGQQQALLTERDQQVQTARRELASREERTRQLQAEQAELQQQFAAARTNIQSLNQQLQRSSGETAMSREQLEAMQAALRKQAEQSAALERQVADLARSNQAVLTEKQKLAGELQVAEVEKRHATEQAVRMQEQVQVERAEKAKLAEGVKALASRSGELVTEIRENRPLTPNTIFNDFISNRVNVQITASRPGLLGEATRRKDAITVLATDGTNTFALCHVEDTPLVLLNPGTDWQQFTGTIARSASPDRIPIRSLSFQFRDPRIVWMPVNAADARVLAAKVYRLSAEPYKFQDAVLVGANEGYYGECRFEIDLTTPDHVRLDRNVLKGIFGRFNPSRGDLVFSKQGELLGVMANNSYCKVIRNFDPAAVIPFNENVQNRAVGQMLGDLSTQVRQMPLKLQ